MGKVIYDISISDTWTISIKYGPMDAKFTGKFSPDSNNCSGSWRSSPGADEMINTSDDIRGVKTL